MPRRMISIIKVNLQGRNPRYIVINLTVPPDMLHEKTYCARSNMENQIKQQQLDLYADRTSCHWRSNQFGRYYHQLLTLLLKSIRQIGLKGTEPVI